MQGWSHQGNGATLNALPLPHLLVFRANTEDPEINQWFLKVTGTSLPKPCTMTRGSGFLACWQGPNQIVWQSVDAERHQFWRETLASSPDQLHCPVVESSDYFLSFGLEGYRLFDVLRQGCPFNWNQASPGNVVFSRYEKASIMVACIQDLQVNILVRRSFADYLWNHLVHAIDQLSAITTNKAPQMDFRSEATPSAAD